MSSQNPGMGTGVSGGGEVELANRGNVGGAGGDASQPPRVSNMNVSPPMYSGNLTVVERIRYFLIIGTIFLGFLIIGFAEYACFYETLCFNFNDIEIPTTTSWLLVLMICIQIILMIFAYYAALERNKQHLYWLRWASLGIAIANLVLGILGFIDAETMSAGDVEDKWNTMKPIGKDFYDNDVEELEDKIKFNLFMLSIVAVVVAACNFVYFIGFLFVTWLAPLTWEDSRAQRKLPFMTSKEARQAREERYNREQTEIRYRNETKQRQEEAKWRERQLNTANLDPGDERERLMAPNFDERVNQPDIRGSFTQGPGRNMGGGGGFGEINTASGRPTF
mmetsp:Transcript_24145/g.27340  ORF Transcript_24145/g.27340 Transcript_24145/m.27340 type:complete len:336 (+) Transcript_24145:48-1055(+)